MKKDKYISMMTPKGNNLDGFSFSYEFDKAFLSLKKEENGTKKEMINEWITKNINRDERTVFHDVKTPKALKI